MSEYKMIGREPTQEMLPQAWREAAGKCDHDTLRRIFRAMWDAAPQVAPMEAPDFVRTSPLEPPLPPCPFNAPKVAGLPELAEQLDELASDMAYEGNQTGDQETASRAVLIEKCARILLSVAQPPADHIADAGKDGV